MTSLREPELMSCPCGRGDYVLREACPYGICPVHGGRTASPPGKVGIAGDWHGNRMWACSAIRQMCRRLPDEDPKIILHAGDFGVAREDTEYAWKGRTCGRQTYLEAVSKTLAACGAQLWFCEGNHEDHDLLDEAAEAARDGEGTPWPRQVQLAPHLYWLPRGYRWEWHGTRWLALGGAVSVDKLLRERAGPGLWFPQEAITDEQEAAVIAGGHADVMLCHDAPSETPLSLMRPPPREWAPMIPEADAHRERMQRICAAVKPSWLFHGHYHQSRITSVRTVWGTCRFTALDMDGTQENWGILDTRTMKWEW